MSYAPCNLGQWSVSPLSLTLKAKALGTVAGRPGAARPNIAVEPTPNSFRSCVAPAIGRASPPAFGFHQKQKVSTRPMRGDDHVVQRRRVSYGTYPQPAR